MRCVMCLCSRLCDYDVSIELVKDITALEHSLKSMSYSRHLFKVFGQPEVNALLNLLQFCGYDCKSPQYDVSSILLISSAQLLRQLVILRSPCVTPILVKKMLETAQRTEPTCKAIILSTVSDSLRLIHGSASQLQTEMPQLFDECAKNLRQAPTSSTTNAFRVLTGLLEQSNLDQGSSRQYIALCKEILAQSSLNSRSAVDSANITNLAITGLLVLASKHKEFLFEPAHPALIGLFKDLSNLSQPVVCGLCNLLVVAVKKYGSARKVVYGCFDALLGECLRSSPPQATLVTILDCLISLGGSSDFFSCANTSSILEPLIGLLDTRRDNLDSPNRRALLCKLYEVITVIFTTNNLQMPEALLLGKLYEHTGEQYEYADLRHGVVRLFSSLLQAKRATWPKTVPLKSCLNAIYSTIKTYDDRQTSLEEVLIIACLFSDLVSRAVNLVVHNSSRYLDKHDNSQDFSNPVMCALHFITECLPIIMEQAILFTADSELTEQLEMLILDLLTQSLRINLSLSLPSTAHDAVVQCLRRVKHCIHIRNKALLFYFILSVDNDISTDTRMAVASGLDEILEKLPSSPNAEYCKLMLYSLMDADDITVGEVNDVVGRISDAFGEWKANFQRNAFRLLVKLVTMHQENDTAAKTATKNFAKLVTAMLPETVDLLAPDFEERTELLTLVVSQKRLNKFAVRSIVTAFTKGKLSYAVSTFQNSPTSITHFVQSLMSREAIEALLDNGEAQLLLVCKLIQKLVENNSSFQRFFDPLAECALLLMNMPPAVRDGLDIDRIRALLQLIGATLTRDSNTAEDTEMEVEVDQPMDRVLFTAIDMPVEINALYTRLMDAASTFYVSAEPLPEILTVIHLAFKEADTQARSWLNTILLKKKQFLRRALEIHFPLALQLLLMLRPCSDVSPIKLSGAQLQSMARSPKFPIHQRILAIKVLVAAHQNKTDAGPFQLDTAVPVERLKRIAHTFLLSPPLEQTGLKLWKAVGGEIISVLTIRLKVELGCDIDQAKDDVAQFRDIPCYPLQLHITRELERHLPPPEYIPRPLFALLKACHERRS
ncbi:hypothetical protein BIW11_12855 [Tropilaelaps mercedesae]|uniref:Uncharacterized protein n=1 Tax=Tropilaelaps mercedesae TaxID=418985 RepID=A0A1V9X565_9ACAR|nr:hypothetical protein BIW11_12855 [Tropilaelaps mercedesae]